MKMLKKIESFLKVKVGFQGFLATVALCIVNVNTSAFADDRLIGKNAQGEEYDIRALEVVKKLDKITWGWIDPQGEVYLAESSIFDGIVPNHRIKIVPIKSLSTECSTQVWHKNAFNYDKQAYEDNDDKPIDIQNVPSRVISVPQENGKNFESDSCRNARKTPLPTLLKKLYLLWDYIVLAGRKIQQKANLIDSRSYAEMEKILKEKIALSRIRIQKARNEKWARRAGEIESWAANKVGINLNQIRLFQSDDLQFEVSLNVPSPEDAGLVSSFLQSTNQKFRLGLMPNLKDFNSTKTDSIYSDGYVVILQETKQNLRKSFECQYPDCSE